MPPNNLLSMSLFSKALSIWNDKGSVYIFQLHVSNEHFYQIISNSIKWSDCLNKPLFLFLSSFSCQCHSLFFFSLKQWSSPIIPSNRSFFPKFGTLCNSKLDYMFLFALSHSFQPILRFIIHMLSINPMVALGHLRIWWSAIPRMCPSCILFTGVLLLSSNISFVGLDKVPSM